MEEHRVVAVAHLAQVLVRRQQRQPAQALDGVGVRRCGARGVAGVAAGKPHLGGNFWERLLTKRGENVQFLETFFQEGNIYATTPLQTPQLAF